MSLPSTTRAWQYNDNKGGIAKQLRLNEDVTLPTPKGSKQVLVRVLAVALNPVDHKPAETLLFKFAFSKPSTPGADFAGEIVQVPQDCSFQQGDRVFGKATNAFAGGMLSEYAVAGTDNIVALKGIAINEAAAIPVAGLTAYQCIEKAKPNSRIFINGGSGGTGIFGIQIARILGHTVTVSCSGRNVDLCRSLGAEVIDYTRGKLLEDLRTASSERPFDLVIDNIYNDPKLYWEAHTYTTEKAPYVITPISPTSWSFMRPFLSMKLLPGFLGGGQRKFEGFIAQHKVEQLEQMRDWIAEKKMKIVVDQVLPFEQANSAMERMASGRVVGKVIIEIGGKAT